MEEIDPIYTQPEKGRGLLFFVILASLMVAGAMFLVLDHAGPKDVPAPGSTVYRCTVNGVTLYSNTPCKGGTPVEVSRR